MGFDACCVTDHPVGDAEVVGGGWSPPARPLRRFVVRSGRYNVYSLTYTRPCAGLPQPASLCEVRVEPRCLVGRPCNLGVAARYLRPESDAVGVDIDERNELTDEAIDVLRLVWSEDSVTYVGRHFRSRATTMRPRSSQTRLPVWIGGNSTRAYFSVPWSVATGGRRFLCCVARIASAHACA